MRLKFKHKFCFGILMAVVMLFVSLPISAVEVNAATTLTEEEFAEKIAALQDEYPHGQYWSLNNGTISSGKYKGTAIAGDKSCTSNSNCGAFAINGTETAWQCHGFALLLSDKIFGSNRNSNASLWQKTSYTLGSCSAQLYAGDVIRLFSTGNNGHTIFVYKVTSDTVYYADCNSNYDCGIRWTSKSITAFKKDIVYILHYQGNTLTGNGAVTPTLHIQYHANGGAIEGSDTITGYRYKVSETAGLNMRSGAGTSYGVVTSLSNGTTFDVAIENTKTANGYTWGKTTVGGNTGWVVISDFVSKVETLRATDYYIQNSMIFRSKYSEVHQQNLKYGEEISSGLYDDTTFKLTRDGYTFLGWTLTLDGNEIWDQNAPLYPEQLCPDLKNGDQTIVVYAAWQKNECQHSATEETKAATCTQAGYTVTTCSICGVELSRAEIPATGHSYTELITDATCTADGSKEYTCAACSDTYTEIIPATGHDYQNNVCVNCGDTLIVEYGVELHVSGVQAAAGETVTVDVILDKNVGFTYLNLMFDYDAEALELISVTNGTIVESLTQGRNYIWACAENASATGVLATLTFAVKENASVGAYALAVLAQECCNADETDIAVKTENGTVTVVDCMYGDCTGDGEINGKDATRLLRYLANFDYSTNTSTVEISRGADCNGDGLINGKDVTRLLRYLAHLDSATGESSVELGS